MFVVPFYTLPMFRLLLVTAAALPCLDAYRFYQDNIPNGANVVVRTHCIQPAFTNFTCPPFVRPSAGFGWTLSPQPPPPP